LNLLPWRWKQLVLLRRRYISTRLHGITPKNTTMLTLRNETYRFYCSWCRGNHRLTSLPTAPSCFTFLQQRKSVNTPSTYYPLATRSRGKRWTFELQCTNSNANGVHLSSRPNAAPCLWLWCREVW
jgi:hypothetical protein